MDVSQQAAKRRKVRKGTRSCWECRRRKIKCEFKKEDDAVCSGCQARQLSCVSQEYKLPDPSPGTGPAQDRRLSQRLGRLEDLMEKLVHKTASEDVAAYKSPSADESPATTQYTCLASDGADIFDSSIAGDAHHVTSMSTGRTPLDHVTLPTPQSPAVKTASRLAKYASISKQLLDQFPAQETLYAISQRSPGAKYVLAVFYSQKDQRDGKPQPISSLAQIPDVSSHPAMIAKHLLDPAQTMEDWVGMVSRLVTSDDELIGSLEGLECLILQSFYQSDAGHLRKAWMTSRRALNLAQLMGIHRRSTKFIRSCDPSFDPKRQPSPSVLWFRINCSDRYLSLVLGLPIGSRDESFLEDSDSQDEGASDRLGRVYAIMSGRIAERNLMSGSEAYVMTQSLDLEIEKASKLMGALWWKLPDMSSYCGWTEACSDDMSAVKLQVRHFSLLILLHLPYLLRDRDQRRYEYNRTTCMQASRAVLLRFLEFRNAFTTATAGRHVDYSALVAAMTLLLGYLGTPWPEYESQRSQDRELAEKTQHKMEEMASLNNDQLYLESAETIRQLMPIVQCCTGGTSTQGSKATVHLSVPFLGTVNIHPSLTPPASHAASVLPSTGSTPTTANPATNAGLLSHTPQSLSPESPVNGHCPYISMDGCLDPDFSMSDASFVVSQWPCFTADLEDWALQGVDTTYWSMLNSDIA
ncbi:hypothetical protein BGZ63DRAFT_361188 [Mariannaea sp. PMI_226]|nr:hypothetical protein BGZ63DRAFT_361188 [Mariannaea sp. PMI_226]